jgi:hypothetical protein
LTAEVAMKLEYYWQLSSELALSDREICDRIGIKFKTLQDWLYRRRRVKIGDREPERLTDIRARARVACVTSYLARMHALVMKAEAAGNLKLAARITERLMIMQFPHKFGRNVRPPDDGESPTELVRGMMQEVEDYHELSNG